MSNQTTTTSRFVLPVALWGSRAPSHRISCVHLMNNEKYLITGSQDGQLCVWELEHSPVLTITPRSMLFGHSAPVLCVADGDFTTKNTLVSSCDSGQMCLWNVDDGQCLELKKTQYTHTFMQSFKVSSKECRLFCIGHYAEILVIDPKTFGIRFRLSSKEQPDWISAIHILQPPQLSNIVIIGLSIAGIVRIWTVTDEASKCLDPIYDNDRKALACTKSVQIISNPESMRLILIVCPQQWQIYDATDFERLCTVEAPEGGQWAGGNFITRDQVLVWSDRGEAYLYQVTTKRGADKQPSATRLKARLSCNADGRFLYAPKMSLASTSGGKLLVRGDDTGTITVWPVNTAAAPPQDQVLSVGPKQQQSLESAWRQAHVGQTGLPGDQAERGFTCSVYMPAVGRLACGRADGSILVSSVARLAHLRLGVRPTSDSLDAPDCEAAGQTSLRAHSARVNCLLYPNGTNPRYDERHLLSGGSDFAVCLWDVAAGTLVHRFVVHAGRLEQFLVPPNECSGHLQQSVCCVASDHSVSILNLKERRCSLLASRHPFPVSAVKWRPADDSLVVGCTDGSAHVWRLETGHLVRVLQGSPAEDTLAACDVSKQAKEPNNEVSGLAPTSLSAVIVFVEESLRRVVSRLFAA